MNFNSIEFLLLFFPVVAIIYHLVRPGLRVLVITVSSLVFYGYSGGYPLIFLILTIAWGFLTAFLFSGNLVSKRASLLISISFPLMVLFLFKYLRFFLDSVGAEEWVYDMALPILSVTLPAGISFYTFQVLSYSVDVRDNRITAEKNFVIFSAFISFFSQLIAGPILRYEQLRDQLKHISSEKSLSCDIAMGVKCLSFGLFYKTFFSDVLYGFYNHYSIQNNDMSLDALYSVLAYSFIIYFDFWGYSLMALGIAHFFGIRIPRNFREPYLSHSPKEFWRRWHVTLSYWLRDYVYIKLGGNSKYFRNILIVFLATGLWHGAGWNFVVWGAYHAAFVILYHYTRGYYDKLPSIMRIAITFMVVSFGWPLFYLSVGEYYQLLGHIFSLTPGTTYNPIYWGLLLLVAVFTFSFREDRWIFNEGKRRIVDSPVTHATMVFGSILFLSFSRTFIYFQF